jgi:transcriptional regulator GlxA family with amidase domain
MKPTVEIVVWDGVELLDLAGPGEVFAVAGFPVRIVAARPGSVVSQGFLEIVPQGVLGEGPTPGILVVPGGGTEGAVADQTLVEQVARVGAKADLVLSVCTGALVLAAAGLLDGLEATTWHGALARLRQAAPHTRVREDLRVVDNGRLLTTAGVSAGIDGALHVVERLLGAEDRARVVAYMEYREEKTL